MIYGTAHNKLYNINLTLDDKKIGIEDAFILKVMDNKQGKYILTDTAGTLEQAKEKYTNLCDVYYEPYKKEVV